MTKTITGRIGDLAIQRTIQHYNPSIPEEDATTQREIIGMFEQLGYNSEDVTF